MMKILIIVSEIWWNINNMWYDELCCALLSACLYHKYFMNLSNFFKLSTPKWEEDLALYTLTHLKSMKKWLKLLGKGISFSMMGQAKSQATKLSILIMTKEKQM